MSFPQDSLAHDRPSSVRPVELPRRESYFPSPADWRDEVLYFLLPDRFSDGKEANRPLLDVNQRLAARPAGFGFNHWAESGGGRYQGGTIAAISTKLQYLHDLGITTLWIGPVFKQRTERNDFHGYAIQDFLDVDPRLGTRQDVVDLVAAAHGKNMRVILDIIFNHTGNNWAYGQNGAGDRDPGYLPWPQFHQRGRWRDGNGGLLASQADPAAPNDGVWPTELWPESYYTRAGDGKLGAGKIDDPHAEFRRTDFVGDRDVNFDGTRALNDFIRCYKYWIALTDCDGFRIDTLKHFDEETGRNFCGAVKEYANNLGKKDFFLVGEVAGSNKDADYYLKALKSNLNATLDIGEIRPTLTATAKGLTPPQVYFDMLENWDDSLGSHRNAGRRRVSILDDHDHVSGAKVRFSSDAVPAEHAVVAGVALQMFTLGIPCIYYGTEQAFAGPEKSERVQYLPDYNVGDPPPDKYLREAMFGPDHPRKAGVDGIGNAANNFDHKMPGFGPFGTSGAHCFNAKSQAYVRIAALAGVRRRFPCLRYGREYQRPISNFGQPFALPDGGELIAWSRLLDDEELVCVVNGNGGADRGGDVLVDPGLNSPDTDGTPWRNSGGQPFFEVIANTAQAAAIAANTVYNGTHPVGQHLAVHERNGTRYIELRGIGPSEVVILSNRM